jgi:hypothetical protein
LLVGPLKAKKNLSLYSDTNVGTKAKPKWHDN